MRGAARVAAGISLGRSILQKVPAIPGAPRRRPLYLALRSPSFRCPAGPMYFVSRALVAQLNADAALQRHASDTVRSANDSRAERFLPWEDVFTGMALAQSASGGALASVHLHMARYAEGWQFASTPSVLLWHMKIKSPHRIVDVERWSSQQQPCAPSAVALTCGNTFTSCNGGTWLRCMSMHNKTTCATKRVRLNSTEAKPRPARPASLRMGRNAIAQLERRSAFGDG